MVKIIYLHIFGQSAMGRLPIFCAAKKAAAHAKLCCSFVTQPL